MTRSIQRLVVWGPIEMQSSPVLIVACTIVTPVDFCTCMPSVLGLFPGATMSIPRTDTPVHPKITTWNSSLFIDVSPLIFTFLESLIVSDCKSHV